MTYVMKLLTLSDGESWSPFDNQYVVEYDPSNDGVAPHGALMPFHLVTTPDLALAKRYDSASGYEAYTAVDSRTPLRPDGKPNRPITMWHIEFVNVKGGE